MWNWIRNRVYYKYAKFIIKSDMQLERCDTSRRGGGVSKPLTEREMKDSVTAITSPWHGTKRFYQIEHNRKILSHKGSSYMFFFFLKKLNTFVIKVNVNKQELCPYTYRKGILQQIRARDTCYWMSPDSWFNQTLSGLPLLQFIRPCEFGWGIGFKRRSVNRPPALKWSEIHKSLLNSQVHYNIHRRFFTWGLLTEFTEDYF